MAVNDVYEATLKFSLDTRNPTVSIHLLETSASNEDAKTTAEALAPLVVTQFWSDWWQQFASQILIFDEIRVQKIWPTREIFIDDDSDAGGGTQLSDAMISANAILVTEYAGIWGRRWTGKSFWPGLPEDDETLGAINAPTLANIQAGADSAFLDPIPVGPPVSGEWQPCVFSRQQVKDGLTPTASPIATPVVNATVTHQTRRRRPLAG